MGLALLGIVVLITTQCSIALANDPGKKPLDVSDSDVGGYCAGQLGVTYGTKTVVSNPGGYTVTDKTELKITATGSATQFTAPNSLSQKTVDCVIERVSGGSVETTVSLR